MSRPSKIETLSKRGASNEDELLKLLWEVPRLWRAAMDKRLRPLGLSEAKWRTVLLLARADHPVSQIELANLLGIEAPSLARLLDRLGADGWIERQTAVHDRRVKTIHLLPKASGVIKKIDAVIVAVRREVLCDVSGAEVLACTRTLKNIRDRVERSAAVVPIANGNKRRHL
jgi:MarR family transcriptional regulator for hemolysin